MSNLLRHIANTLDKMNEFEAVAFYLAVLVAVVFLALYLYLRRVERQNKIKEKDIEILHLSRSVRDLSRRLEYYKDRANYLESERRK